MPREKRDKDNKENMPIPPEEIKKIISWDIILVAQDRRISYIVLFFFLSFGCYFYFIYSLDESFPFSRPLFLN